MSVSLLVVIMATSGSEMAVTSQVLKFEDVNQATEASYIIRDAYSLSSNYTVRVTIVEGTV